MTTGVAAGELDFQGMLRVVAASGRDPLGGVVREPADVATIRFGRKPASQKDVERQGAIGSIVTHAIKMRWRAGVDERYEIAWTDPDTGRLHVYRFESVLEIERRTWLRVLAHDIG